VNKWLFKLHRWTALLAALPFVLICATGSAVVFKYEIDNAMDTKRVSVATPGTQRLKMASLFARVDDALPGHEIVGWQWFDDAQRADLVYVIPHGTADWYYITVDPFTGIPLSDPRALDSSVTDWLLELHYTLLIGDIGMLVSGFIGVLLCISVITGLILHRKFWTTLPRIRWGARRVLAFSDVHKISGALAAPMLLILGFTGAWWNIEHGVEELSEHWQGDAHPVVAGPLFNKALSLDAIMAKAEASVDGFEAMYLSLPWEAGLPLSVYGRVPTRNPLASDYSSYLSFDGQTGSLVSTYDIREAGFFAQIIDSYRELHFGTFGGVVSRALWFLVGLVPLALALTGLWLWWHRRQKARVLVEKRSGLVAPLALGDR
jgi:uncharacterized iron-regulated membrane protein